MLAPVTDPTLGGLVKRMAEDAELYAECQDRHAKLAAAWCR